MFEASKDTVYNEIQAAYISLRIMGNFAFNTHQTQSFSRFRLVTCLDVLYMCPYIKHMGVMRSILKQTHSRNN